MFMAIVIHMVESVVVTLGGIAGLFNNSLTNQKEEL